MNQRRVTFSSSCCSEYGENILDHDDDCSGIDDDQRMMNGGKVEECNVCFFLLRLSQRLDKNEQQALFSNSDYIDHDDHGGDDPPLPRYPKNRDRTSQECDPNRRPEHPKSPSAEPWNEYTSTVSHVDSISEVLTL